MEINEKLDIFYRATVEAADGQSRELLEGQERLYRELLADYEKKKQEEWQERVRVAEAKVRREVNRAVSGEMMEEKKRCHAKKEERKAELFELVEENIRRFRETEAYRELLAEKIRTAASFAEGAELTVYLDPEDAPLRERLERETGCALDVGEKPFGGGIRAAIPSKNVLLEEAFAERLAEERNAFSF